MILNYDSDKKEFSWLNIIKKIKGELPEVSDQVKELFESFPEDKKLLEIIDTDSFKNIKDIGFKNWIDGLDDVEKSAITAGNAIDIYQSHIASAAKSSNIFSKMLSNVGSAFKTVLSFGVNLLAAAAIEKGIEIAFKYVYELINASEIAIQKGKEARETIESINDTYNNKVSGVENVKDRYGELLEKNNNGTISSEEYQEFLA